MSRSPRVGDMLCRVRVALISDLHGNELALDAVLADADRAGFDQLVCLGDVATLGPRPSGVLARLQARGCPCILGNHDEFMIDAPLVRRYTESKLIVDSVDATREALSQAETDFIRTFVRTLDLGDIFLFHATPRSNMEDLLATTPDATVDEMLDGRRARVLAGGHTHLQMLRQHRGMAVVNTGSLGAPFREYAFGGTPVILPHAEYAIVEVTPVAIRVDLRRVALEPAALVAQVDGWDNPLANGLRAMYGG
jgi:predicted phosphodiesterase